MKREMLEQAWYQIGRSPYLFETQATLVDIDNVEYLELASFIYERKLRRGSVC